MMFSLNRALFIQSVTHKTKVFIKNFVNILVDVKQCITFITRDKKYIFTGSDEKIKVKLLFNLFFSF